MSRSNEAGTQVFDHIDAVGGVCGTQVPDAGLDPDAAEGVARIVELVDLIAREHGPAAASRMVLADIEDATRAVQHSSVYVAYDFVDHALVAVLALDPGAHAWPGVERLVEEVGALRVAAERSPQMPTRDIYAYGAVRDGLDVLWTDVRRAVSDRERLGEVADGLDRFEDDGDIDGE